MGQGTNNKLGGTSASGSGMASGKAGSGTTPSSGAGMAHAVAPTAASTGINTDQMIQGLGTSGATSLGQGLGASVGSNIAHS